MTTNFNRMTGIINDRSITFQIGSSDTTIPIRKEKIRYILLKKKKQEQVGLDTKAETDLFVMTNGDLLTGRPVQDKVVIETDYADIPVTFSEIKQIAMQGGENVTAVVTKTNKDVMRGTLQTEEISLDLDIGVVVEAVYKDKFAAVFVGDGNAQVAQKFGIQQPVQGESDGALFAGAPSGDVWTNSLGMKFVYIKPGAFTMGSNKGDDDEQPPHKVTLSKGFYLGVTEVTQQQWEQVMGENPSHFNEPEYYKIPNLPVESVSWKDVQAFIDKLSQQEGVEYRLPTEAEWEYACRAGTTTAYYWGGRFDEDYAWCKVNSDERIQPVGQKKPNAWGLYDMSGNVWEWCQDGYGDYPGSHLTDPLRQSGFLRVIRGGCWSFDPELCRSAYRYDNSPGFTHFSLGFRLSGSK